MRALAEAPRLLFHYTNIEYEDLMSWDYYDKEWSEVKPNIPFKQLPMLIIDKKYEISEIIKEISGPYLLTESSRTIPPIFILFSDGISTFLSSVGVKK